MGIIPFFMYFKFYHNDHHKYQGVVGIDTDIPTEFEARLLSNRVGKAIFLFFQTWFYALRPMFVKQPVITKWHVLNYAVQITFVTGTWFLFGFGPLIYLALSAHMAGSWHPVASHFIAEHYSFKGDDETFSYYGPLNYLTFNVGYHNEHHDFPTVAWSRLPALHEMAKEEYGQLPHHVSWTKVLTEFVSNDKYNLFNRVKRADKHGIAKKVRKDDRDADYTGSWLFGHSMTEVTASTKKKTN